MKNGHQIDESSEVDLYSMYLPPDEFTNGKELGMKAVMRNPF